MKIDMKKMNIGAFVVSGGLLLAASGCTESDFDSKYEDPSKVNQVTISNLMVGVFQKVKDYDVYEYGRFFGFDSQFVANMRKHSVTVTPAACIVRDIHLP